MQHRFYNAANCSGLAPINEKYSQIADPIALYDLLTEIWSENTCAPRLRSNWSTSNPTVGQCSITAFLAQDIFGGQVWGILRPGGTYHCFNIVKGVSFDLTSEQFGVERLDYLSAVPQSRDVHFEKEEKLQRYLALKAGLEKALGIS